MNWTDRWHFYKKKRELIKLQQELNDLDSRKIYLHVLDAMMCKFDGSDIQDVSKWIADLENVCESFRYSERDKLVAARHLMAGHAKRFTEIVRIHTYAEFKEKLLLEFRRAFTVQDVLKQLYARSIKPDETPRQYAVEMQFIASRADVSESDLIDIIIDGLNDKSTLVAMLYGAATIGELKFKMEKYDKKRHAVPVKQSTVVSSSTGVVPKRYVSTNTDAVASASGQDLSNVRCYNCFKYGNYQSRCSEPKRLANSCFICHQVGHTRHECPQKKKPTDAPGRTETTVAAAVQQQAVNMDEAEIRCSAT